MGKMEFYLSKFISGYFLGIALVIIIIIIMVISAGSKTYNDTWTIESGKFKSIYDDREECIKDNMWLGLDSDEMCDDDSKVIYRNK